MLDEVRRNFGDEAGVAAILRVTVSPPLERVHKIELLHRPRDTDVTEAAFLLHLRLGVERTLVRQKAFFHPDDEDEREL